MMKIRRNILAAVLLAAAALTLTAAAYASDDGYIPLRAAFEEKGYTVSWYKERPDEIFVRIGGQMQVFRNHSDTVVTDEGIFHTARETYIENGQTFVSADAVELVRNLNLYHVAIEDAEVQEESELYPLHALDETAERVLLCTWHKYPQSYIDGTEVTINFGDVWTIVPEELAARGDLGSGEAFVQRMTELLGLPPQNGKSHFTLMWAKPEDVFRPARCSGISSTEASLAFPERTSEEYRQWFSEQQQYSFQPHRFPWTGLGYTFDWADNGTDYGLTEYVVKNGAVVTVEKTLTNDAFVEYLKQMAE